MRVNRLGRGQQSGRHFRGGFVGVSGELNGHRYLFGLLALGGLLCDLPNDACAKALAQSQETLKRLNELEQRLRVSSSFLDRLEEVGVVALRNATVYGLLGPIARASGLVRDLRKRNRIRVTKTLNSTCRVNRKATATRACVFCSPKRDNRFASWNNPRPHCKRAASANLSVSSRRSAGLGRSAARRGVPLGAAGRNGRIARYRIIPPSFANWHGFHLAVEKFAFQDFPIMLSTFDLSVAENDR